MTYFFATIIYSPNPTFASSLSEINDFTSCLALPGFIVNHSLKVILYIFLVQKKYHVIYPCYGPELEGFHKETPLNTQGFIAIYAFFKRETLHKKLLLSINIGYITVENVGHQGRSPIQGSVFSVPSVVNICQNKGQTIFVQNKRSVIKYSEVG